MESIDCRRSEVVFYKFRQQKSSVPKNTDIYKENFCVYEGAQIRALGQSGRILSPGPSAREAQDKRLLASRPSSGRTFHSIGAGGRTGAGDGS